MFYRYKNDVIQLDNVIAIYKEKKIINFTVPNIILDSMPFFKNSSIKCSKPSYFYIIYESEEECTKEFDKICGCPTGDLLTFDPFPNE